MISKTQLKYIYVNPRWAVDIEFIVENLYAKTFFLDGIALFNHIAYKVSVTEYWSITVVRIVNTSGLLSGVVGRGGRGGGSPLHVK